VTSFLVFLGMAGLNLGWLVAFMFRSRRSRLAERLEFYTLKRHQLAGASQQWASPETADHAPSRQSHLLARLKPYTMR